MTKLQVILIWSCCSILLPSKLIAQLSDEATISVLTCRAGDEIYNMFGHNALRIQDPLTKKDEVYNYGLFDPSQKGFIMKFLRRKLKYWVGKSSMQGFLRGYKYEKRTVIEQVLNLDQNQKNTLYAGLNENLKPENKYYEYEFFFDNCATRLRDILNDNLQLLEFPSENEEDFSFRQLLDKFNFVSPWIDFGMDLLVGTPADKVASIENEMFLPEYLFKHLASSSINHRPFVKDTKMILDYEAEYVQRTSAPFFTPAILFSFLLLLELLLIFRNPLNNRLVNIYDKCFYLALGIGSLILLFMWFGTGHITTKHNLNVLWMNPLFLILPFNLSYKMNLVAASCLILALLSATFLQQMHIASIILILIALFKLLRNLRQKAQG